MKNNQWLNCDFKNDLIQITNEIIAKKLLFLTHYRSCFFKMEFLNQAESFLIIDENDSKYMTNEKCRRCFRRTGQTSFKKIHGPELKDRMSQKCELFVNINQESIHPKTLEAEIKTRITYSKAIVSM